MNYSLTKKLFKVLIFGHGPRAESWQPSWAKEGVVIISSCGTMISCCIPFSSLVSPQMRLSSQSWLFHWVVPYISPNPRVHCIYCCGIKHQLLNHLTSWNWGSRYSGKRLASEIYHSKGGRSPNELLPCHLSRLLLEVQQPDSGDGSLPEAKGHESTDQERPFHPIKHLLGI